MTLARLLLLLVVSALVTIPIVWLIPHARKSPFFDVLLWIATVVVAFLCAWLALGLSAVGTLAWLNVWSIGDVSVLPALVGAVVGALLINLSLWVIDQFNQVPQEDETES